MSVMEDISETAIIIWGAVTKSNDDIHSGLIFLFSLFGFIAFLYAIYAIKSDRDFLPILLPIIIIILTILYSARSYTSALNIYPMSENERINMANRLSCTLSMLTNYSYMLIRVLIVLFIMTYVFIAIQTIIEMWVLKDTNGGWFVRLLEFFAKFLGLLSIKSKRYIPNEEKQREDFKLYKTKIVDYEYRIANPILFSLNTLLDPNKILNQNMEDTKLPNWKMYIIVSSIGAMFSLVLGFLAVDYKKDCKETAPNYEKRIKNEMSQGIVIVSVLICIPFVLYYMYKIITHVNSK